MTGPSPPDAPALEGGAILSVPKLKDPDPGSKDQLRLFWQDKAAYPRSEASGCPCGPASGSFFRKTHPRGQPGAIGHRHDLRSPRRTLDALILPEGAVDRRARYR